MHSAAAPSRRRLVCGLGFALVTVGACALLGRRFTDTSWPLHRANFGLVGAATVLYFASFVFRALGWQKLFPADSRPHRARCLAACGAAAASGVVLPFRLDYLVKVGTLRRMPGVKLGLEAIALSIISLGLVDAVAFLPLSISATATSSSNFRYPLLVGGQRVARLSLFTRRGRLSRFAARAVGSRSSRLREELVAWGFLLGCWSTRAAGSTLLLAALGIGFSPTLALIVLCVSAAAGLIPIASGGALANVSATAGVLLLVGVDRQHAVNFGLASGLLLSGAALAAALVGAAASLAGRLRVSTI